MINNPKKRFLLIFILFLIHFGLKAQITSSIYIFNQGDYPNNLVRSSNGDFYFSVNQQIKKLTPDGEMTTFANVHTYINNMVIDSMDNLYFVDGNNWPPTIQKVTPDGAVSVFLSGEYYPMSMVFDNLGNLYFFDNYSQSFLKVTPDGNITTYATGNYYPNSLVFDNAGNLCFFDNNSQSFLKVTPDGNITTYVDGNFNLMNMAADNSGNIYFTDENNWPPTIQKLNSNGTYQVYLSNDVNLTQPDGLVSDPSGILYYIDYNWNTNVYQLIKVALPCDQPSAPIALDQSFTETSTVADLVALGDNIKWYKKAIGGIPLVSSTVLTPRTYYVTQSVNDCESNRIPVAVTIYKMGLSKFGQYIADDNLKVTTNGAIHSTSYVNKYGKSTIINPAPDGNLNYTIYSSPASCVYGESDFMNFTNTSAITSSGTNSASLLLNWSNYNMLTIKGIAIPNGGDQFTTEMTGVFVPLETGTYTFTCEGDDAVDLFIDTINVASHYSCHGMNRLGSHNGVIDLVAGERYTFRARQQENGGGEGLNVFWRRPSENSGWNLYTSELSSK